MSTKTAEVASPAALLVNSVAGFSVTRLPLNASIAGSTSERIGCGIRCLDSPFDSVRGARVRAFLEYLESVILKSHLIDLADVVDA